MGGVDPEKQSTAINEAGQVTGVSSGHFIQPFRPGRPCSLCNARDCTARRAGATGHDGAERKSMRDMLARLVNAAALCSADPFSACEISKTLRSAVSFVA